MFVQRAQAVVLSISMCCVWHFGARGEVVDPVEFGLFAVRVEAAEQQVDSVGRSRAERFGEFAADERGGLVGWERGAVAHCVELDVGLDVFCELNYASSSAASGDL